MFKFKLGQTVYFICDNKINSAVITSRQLVENLLTEGGNRQKNSFGYDGLNYATQAGTHNEKNLFASVKEATDFLAENIKSW